MTSSVQFLFATMNGALFERNPEVLARAEDYLVIDQYPGPGPIQPSGRPHTISVQDSGLSKSRNLALDHATADICYLCDDDVALASDAPERVRDAFERNPEADILIFARGTSFPSEGSTSAESAPHLGNKLPGPLGKALRTALSALLPTVLPTSLRLLGTSSIQIAFRRERILAKSIRFDEQFGLGARFPTSEEALFLHDCFRAGLKIKWVDLLVATHEIESSGARYANRDLAAAKGAMLSRIFGKKRRFAALAFAFKSHPLYRDHMNLFGFLEALDRGARLYEQGSAVSVRPGPDESAWKNDSLALFEALNHSNIRYAAWKDLHELQAFHRGNAEIDLLVHPEDAEAFEKICAEHHFAQFINRPDVYAGAISHFIRFAHGGYSHLHVHRALLTGDHTAKEYDLTPLVDEPFFRGPIRDEIRVLEDHLELAIGMIRLMLKAKNLHGIKMDELHRLREIGAETTPKAAFDWIGSKVGLSSEARNSLTRLIAGEDDELENLCHSEKELSAFRRMSPARARLNQLRVRISNALARRDSLANKVIPTNTPENASTSASETRKIGAAKKAPAIAMIGVDGSGKTTLCDSVQQILGAKISVKRIYLGSNSETYSLPSRLAYLASGVAGRLHLAWSKNAFLCDLKWFTRALLEYSKCRDRVSAIRRGERYTRQGVFVLYERYPIKGLFDYPAMANEVERGEVKLEGRIGAKTRSLLGRIDQLIDRVSPPDATLLIRTRFDRITARRALAHDESEDIQRKLALLERFDGSNLPGLHEIRNEGQQEEALETVLQLVNEQLCSRNS